MTTLDTVPVIDHSFGQDQKRPGETRTLIVVGVTVVMMIVEVTVGLMSGSMALLADGLHMAAHAAALGVSVAAYVFARRHAHNRQFSFGTGKVNALGGFTGAVLLVLFSVVMAWESVERLIEPVPIAYTEAISVAVLGLIVNGACAFILGHDHSHDQQAIADHDSCGHDHDSDQSHHHHDHNLRAAYLHVLADALTSVLAIVALLAAMQWGTVWIDPVIGIAGSLVVARWSIGLLKSTATVLLDMQAPAHLEEQVRSCLESETDRLVDLHIWLIGPQLYALEAILASTAPQPADVYRRRLPDALAHVVIEVHAENAGPPQAKPRQSEDQASTRSPTAFPQ